MKRIIIFILLFSPFLIMLNASAQDSDIFLDERDGNIYLITKYNNQWWMCQNLKYDAGEGSFCYDDDETNCMLQGRWYSFDAANKACPKGFRLPGDDDWKALESFLGMEEKDLNERYNRNSGNLGKSLKTGGGLGFDADFAGLINPNGNDSYMGTHAYFWTSTEIDKTSAWSRVIMGSKNGVDRQIITRGYGLSVRCIKDATE